MSYSQQSRREFIAEMRTFVENECAQIGGLMAELGWTPDHILRGQQLVQCPHNPSHHLPEASLKKHAVACKLRMRGCHKDSLELQLKDDDFYYEKAALVGKVKIDESLLNSILWNHCMENGQVYTGHRPLPVTADDAQVQLSPEERLALYNYSVQQLKEQKKMANVERDEVLTTDWEKIIKKGLLEDGDKPKSQTELMVMLRDQKRRRQSYRAKNVHVTKKSYTEIIREVINNQMEILIDSEEPEDRYEENRSERSYGRRERSPSYRSRNSRSRSRSPRRHSQKDRDRHSERDYSGHEKRHKEHREREERHSRDRQGRYADQTDIREPRRDKRWKDKRDAERHELRIKVERDDRGEYDERDSTRDSDYRGERSSTLSDSHRPLRDCAEDGASLKGLREDWSKESHRQLNYSGASASYRDDEPREVQHQGEMEYNSDNSHGHDSSKQHSKSSKKKKKKHKHKKHKSRRASSESDSEN